MSEREIEELKELLRAALRAELHSTAEFQKALAAIGKKIYDAAYYDALTLKNTTGGFIVEVEV